MMNFWKKTLRASPLLAAALSLASAALQAEESPPWTFKPIEHEVVMVENPEWHAKEDGWLFTCRLRVKSTNLVKPIAHVELEGFLTKDAEEPVWTQRKVIRRKDFEPTYGGGDAQFVRVLVRDAPAGLGYVTLSFDNGDSDDPEE